MKAKRLISLLLSLAMLLSCFTAVCMTVGAEDIDTAINDAVILDFDFSDYKGEDSWKDETGNLTVDTSAFSKGEGRNGAAALASDGGSSIRWMSDVYDPFKQTENGITFVLWLKSDIRSDYAHYFNYKHSPDRGIVMQAGNGNTACLFRMMNTPAGNWDNIQDSGKYPGNGEWMMLAVTQDADGQAYMYLNGDQVASKKFDSEVTPYKIALNGDEVAEYNFLGPTSQKYGQWSNDANFSGDCQRLSMYGRPLNLTEITYLYKGSVGFDEEAIANVETLIETAKAAEAGTQAQIDAYKAAAAAYNALSTLDQGQVSNAADLETVKNSYITATGLLLDFEFNGNYDELLGRNTINDYKGRATIHDEYVELSGEPGQEWQKIGAVFRRDGSEVFTASDNLTVEMRVNANAFLEGNAVSSIFSKCWGFDHMLKVMAVDGGVPLMEMRVTELTGENVIKAHPFGNMTYNDVLNPDNASYVSEEERAEYRIPTDTWVTLAVTQEKNDETVTTRFFIEDREVITTTEFPEFKTLEASYWDKAGGDDCYIIGASDYSDACFNGLIDYCRIYNTAKDYAIPADYTAVDNAITAAGELNEEDYTADSWAALQNAIADVDRTLMASQQAKVDAMALAITNAISNLIDKSLELKIAITPGVLSAGDKGSDITWNAEVTTGDGSTVDFINQNVNFKSYGVYYGMTEEAVNALVSGTETDKAKVLYIDKAEEGETDIDVYTLFGFRLKGVPDGRSRAAKFFITYEYEGNTYTVFSSTDVTSVASAA